VSHQAEKLTWRKGCQPAVGLKLIPVDSSTEKKRTHCILNVTYLEHNAVLTGSLFPVFWSGSLQAFSGLKSSLCTPWKCIGGAEVYLHLFLFWAVDGGDWSTSCPWSFYPGANWLREWVGLRTGVDGLEFSG